MNFLMVLNKDGGTFRSLDVADFARRARRTLEGAGDTAKSRIVAGKELVLALEEAVQDDGIGVVMAGGGDGTVSAAAASVTGSGKVLAVLPAGTMNLFARSLGIPLSLAEAVAAFSRGHVREVDVATVMLKTESRRRQSCVVDGELQPLEPVTEIRILQISSLIG